MDAEREAAPLPVGPVNACNESFRTAVERASGACVVRLFGSAGMEHVDELRRQLLELPSADNSRVVLDLSELHFVNSAGLGAFIALYRRCHELGGQVVLANPRRAVGQVLRVTNLDRLMPIYPDVDSALKQWPQPPAK
jgi:anti-sigma B factor antagonist